jgi:hypothetical protein
MKLLTKEIEKKLRANEVIARETGESGEPVVKWFNPTGAGTWLISDMDEDGRCFGLCDLGMGTPELGSVSIKELEDIRLPFGLGIERDIHWEANKSLMDYANDAREYGYIRA